MRRRRFLIIEVRSHISDVRIRQADNLSRVARVGKDFLISGETCIENDFAAAPRDGPGGAPVKDFSIFQCQNSRAFC